ncbi:MAG: YncE family protein [Nitrososphaerales archaeon]
MSGIKQPTIGASTLIMAAVLVVIITAALVAGVFYVENGITSSPTSNASTSTTSSNVYASSIPYEPPESSVGSCGVYASRDIPTSVPISQVIAVTFYVVATSCTAQDHLNVSISYGLSPPFQSFSNLTIRLVRTEGNSTVYAGSLTLTSSFNGIVQETATLPETQCGQFCSATARTYFNMGPLQTNSSITKFPNSTTITVTERASGSITTGETFSASTTTISESKVTAQQFRVTNISIGNEPRALAYYNGQIFASSYFNSGVFVVNDATNKITAMINVGNEPSSFALDTRTGELFVATSDHIAVINTSSDLVAKNISSGADSVVYDNLSDTLYAGSSYNTVLAFNASTLALVKNITVGYGPTTLLYDEQDNAVFVANYHDRDISIINASTNRVTGNITVGYYSDALTYIPSLHKLYVACQSSNIVDYINTTTDEVLGALNVSDPTGIAYDPFLNDVVVSSNSGNSLILFSAQANSLNGIWGVKFFPLGIVYDDSNQGIYVADQGSGNVTAIVPITG